MSTQLVGIKVGANTKYVISTSGRASSLRRYQILLQELLRVDVAYIAINAGNADDPRISPQRFAFALKGMPCVGGAISRDIKQTIMPFLDELDETAAEVQSVNTVIVGKNGELKGYNTDAFGFKHAIINGMSRSGITVKSAVCYGYGGVSSVVVTILKGLGIDVYISGRNAESIQIKAAELGAKVWRKDCQVDLFVNATPATEAPLHLSHNFLDSIRHCKIAFDHEMPGRYLEEYCREHGIHHIKGTEMYYPQMKLQWTLFLQDFVDCSNLGELLEEAEKLAR